MCRCNMDWIGDDCSINDPPSLISLDDNGLCNTRLGACSNILITGSQFVNTPQLKCYYKQIMVCYTFDLLNKFLIIYIYKMN